MNVITPLVDSHCHLDFPELSSDTDAVLARAKGAGVGHLLTIGTKITKFKDVLKIAERYENVSCSVGIHPHEAGVEPATDVGKLLEFAKHPKVVAFGETGLDFYYEYSPRADQERNFGIHIDAARKANLPVIIHTREAEQDTQRRPEEILHRLSPYSFLYSFLVHHNYLTCRPHINPSKGKLWNLAASQRRTSNAPLRT